MTGLDVVMRAHDPARLDELGRALFSAALQDHRPLRIVLVCQRFGADALAAVRGLAAPILEIVPEVGFTLLNRGDAEPRDARAALLNLGVRAGEGRYLSFLDYDDVAYPESGRLLIDELAASGAAIAFGAVLNTEVTRQGLVPVVKGKTRVFQGAGLRQLFADNFCPVHSFVIDRTRVAADALMVDESLALLEDYALLLQVCAAHPTSWRLKDKVIGEYLLKDDGSNVNPVGTAGRTAAWRAAVAAVGRMKEGLVLSAAVQETLGVEAPGVGAPGLTVAGYLAGPGVGA